MDNAEFDAFFAEVMSNPLAAAAYHQAQLSHVREMRWRRVLHVLVRRHYWCYHYGQGRSHCLFCTKIRQPPF